MDKVEAAMWTAELEAAQKGAKWAREAILAENQVREKYGEPSVQQELADWLKEQEGTDGKQ